VGKSEIRSRAVSTAEIRRDGVNRSEIKRDAVGPSEVRPNAINSDEMADGGLEAADLSAAARVATASASADPTDVVVKTFDVNGGPLDAPFHLLLTC
jgi:hypothetical protein